MNAGSCGEAQVGGTLVGGHGGGDFSRRHRHECRKLLRGTGDIEAR